MDVPDKAANPDVIAMVIGWVVRGGELEGHAPPPLFIFYNFSGFLPYKVILLSLWGPPGLNVFLYQTRAWNNSRPLTIFKLLFQAVYSPGSELHNY